MRDIINLNDSWMFSKEEGVWTEIRIPHTWNNQDGQDGGNDYEKGRFCYRRQFRIPELNGRSAYLEFEGANSCCEVWLNGRYVGKHVGGYSRFRFPVTEILRSAVPNDLEIWVDNRISEDVYPIDADFTFFGGLYRDVNLLLLSPVHFALQDEGSMGIFITPSLRADGNADVCIHAKLETDRPHGQLLAQYRVEDAQGISVCSTKSSIFEEEVRMCLNNPILWNGKESPCLYTLKAFLLEDGKTVDELEIPFGIRRFSVDADKGFFLNGNYMKLKGVARHQDRQHMGNAITSKEHLEDMELIKEVGANAIRLAHYQQSQFFYDLCDREGMIVWAEIPFISNMSKSDQARENAKQQLRELIKQNYNHPSIFFWGIQNEIEFKWKGSEITDNVRELHELAKSLDRTRFTAGANEYMVALDSELNRITDVVGYNQYFGWYRGEIEDLGIWADNFHRENSRKPLCISEYGAEGIVRYHTEKPVRGDYTEEYQTLFHEKSWKAIADRRFIWGSFVWNMFDFASDIRNEGGTRGINNKGLVSHDRGVRKDSFYFYKAQWSREKFVHITGKRFAKRPSMTTQIKVYTNCSHVCMEINGQQLETKHPEEGIAVWTDVLLREGENLITAWYGQECGDRVVLERVSSVPEEYVFLKESTGRFGTNWL